MSDTVCLRTFPNRTAAEFAEAALRSAGIEAFVTADDAGGAAPYVAFTTGGARLMVRRRDAERATRLLEESQG